MPSLFLTYLFYVIIHTWYHIMHYMIILIIWYGTGVHVYNTCRASLPKSPEEKLGNWHAKRVRPCKVVMLGEYKEDKDILCEVALVWESGCSTWMCLPACAPEPSLHRTWFLRTFHSDISSTPAPLTCMPPPTSHHKSHHTHITSHSHHITSHITSHFTPQVIHTFSNPAL